MAPYRGRFASFRMNTVWPAVKMNRTSLWARKGLELTPMTWGSLGQGILTGKYSRDSVFGSNDRRSREVYVNFHGEKLLENLRIVEAMRPLGRNT